MRRVSLTMVAVVSVALLTLSGCADQRDYSSPERLHEAFAEASGTCNDPQDVPASMMGEGTHTLVCLDTITMLIVFDDESSKNSYLAEVLDSDTEAVVGPRWAVVGEDVGQYAGALGGSVPS